MIKRLCFLLLSTLFLPTGVPGPSLADGFSGKWETSYFFNRIVVDVENNGPRVHGVMYLYAPSGDLSTYHFEGSLVEGRLEARHHSGHAFQGRIEGPTSVVGTLTTKTGMKLPIRLTDLRRVE